MPVDYGVWCAIAIVGYLFGAFQQLTCWSSGSPTERARFGFWQRWHPKRTPGDQLEETYGGGPVGRHGQVRSVDCAGRVFVQGCRIERANRRLCGRNRGRAGAQLFHLPEVQGREGVGLRGRIKGSTWLPPSSRCGASLTWRAWLPPGFWSWGRLWPRRRSRLRLISSFRTHWSRAISSPPWFSYATLPGSRAC